MLTMLESFKIFPACDPGSSTSGCLQVQFQKKHQALQPVIKVCDFIQHSFGGTWCNAVIGFAEPFHAIQEAREEMQVETVVRDVVRHFCSLEFVICILDLVNPCKKIHRALNCDLFLHKVIFPCARQEFLQCQEKPGNWSLMNWASSVLIHD